MTPADMEVVNVRLPWSRRNPTNSGGGSDPRRSPFPPTAQPPSSDARRRGCGATVRL